MDVVTQCYDGLLRQNQVVDADFRQLMDFVVSIDGSNNVTVPQPILDLIQRCRPISAENEGHKAPEIDAIQVTLVISF